MKPFSKRVAPAAATTVVSALVAWGILHIILIPTVHFFEGPVYQDLIDEFGWSGIPLFLLWTAIYIFGVALAALFPSLLLAPDRSPLLRSPLLGLGGAIAGMLFVLLYPDFALNDGGMFKPALVVAGLCGLTAGVFASFHHRRCSVSVLEPPPP